MNGERAYGDILRLDKLLEVAHVDVANVGLMLFLSTHQSCEIWLGIALRHLEGAREALGKANPDGALHLLGRLPVVFETLCRQFDALATLDQAEFEQIREELGSASGFQSVRFRELEFLCGARDERFVQTSGFSEQDRARLRGRAGEESVEHAFLAFAGLRGEADDDVRRLRAMLLDVDVAVMHWRSRHAVLAERFIGGRTGTGGSDGASYLWRAARRRLFPSAWG